MINGRHYKSFSEVEGLLSEYGCLHLKFPIILGVSEPTYTDKQLDKFEAADKKTFEFEGKHYTTYKASQVQRKLETSARHAKDRQIIAKAAGDDTLRRQEQERINLITSKYAKFSKAAGLPTKAERMSVSKYHRVKTQHERLTTILTGYETSDGIMVKSISSHLLNREKERGVLENHIIDALTNPLKQGKIRGNRSKQYMGESATVVLNVDTGNIITTWPTSSKKANKLKEKGDGKS
ncbi:MAG: phage minor capsid protein [Clostridiales bacterium]